ncbi:Lysine-specific demethylase 5C [Dissostichus eleginoides]|uniref:Lysine-specific demethylase 5C n=1 Tax=Dissostichus eleginoides TaxID=100907 RepID=A0AAD9B4S2_DISEL|nr:Lysine-specific demethylase 5C [Dissostichus eleginoides]
MDFSGPGGCCVSSGRGRPLQRRPRQRRLRQRRPLQWSRDQRRPGTDSEGVGQGLAGDKDSPAAAPEGDKPGARKGSQAFGTEGSEDNGDGTQVGDSKRSKTEEEEEQAAQGESGGRSRWAAEGGGTGEGQRPGGGQSGHTPWLGGGMMERNQGAQG